MIKIIPAINADNFEEVQQKIKLVEPFFPSNGTGWVQIDVADGTFTKNTIWHNPNDLIDLKTSLNIEVHLMIDHVEERIDTWLLPNVQRIIFHLGATQDPFFVIQKCKETGKEVGIAVGPNESWTKAMLYAGEVDLFQVLAVDPGLPGQKTKEESFEIIKKMREFCKECIIEIDGGMNKETGRRAVEAGANIIVAANAIFSGDDIKKNIKELNGALNR
jgi:ribulose-phosphate 3-epimerase